MRFDVYSFVGCKLKAHLLLNEKKGKKHTATQCSIINQHNNVKHESMHLYKNNNKKADFCQGGCTAGLYNTCSDNKTTQNNKADIPLHYLHAKLVHSD